MNWDGYRIALNFLKGALVAGLAFTGCVTEDAGVGRPRDLGGMDTVPVTGADLPLLFSSDFRTDAEPPRTFPEEKRIRLVEIDSRMAENGGALLGGSKRFVFNLFDDVRVNAETDRMDVQEPGRFTLDGRLIGVEGGWFLLSFHQGAVSATVFHPVLGQFELEPAGGLLGKISEYDPARLPRLGHGMLFPDGHLHFHHDTGLHTGHLPTNLPKRASSAEPVLDLMVVYTAAAAAGSGGETAMLSRIDKAVAEVNKAFLNSRIAAKVNLVHTRQVAYVESGNMGTDLGRMQKAADGHLDDVHALRDEHKADLVSLIVEQAGGIAGIGYVMTSLNSWFKAYAYTVVGRAYTGSYTTLAHELGHNLGCAHDRQNSSSQAAFPYSYGHRFHGTNGVQYRTIMSYAPGNSIPYFSNPDVLYMGTPTGIPDGQANSADNARTINASAPVAEAFYVRAVLPPTTPPGWTARDIGTVGRAGAFSASSGTYTLSGSGADIWGTADGFHYAWQPLDGDGMITARLVSLQNTNPWAKAGVMIREDATPGSRHAFMALTSGNGAAFQRREAAGGGSLHTGTGSGPKWLRLVRSGPSLKGYHSSDGVSWTLLGESVQDLPQSVLVGLAVTSHDNAQLNASVFDNVSIVRDAWSQGDIGSVLNAGSATGYGTVQVRGDGADIWGTADAFFFRHRKLSGDGEIRARVASVQNTDPWAKAGVMIREGLEPGSRHASTFVTSGNGSAFQRREAAGGVSLHTGAAGAAPRWVRMARAGNVFTSYVSTDGLAWTEVGRATLAMGAEAYVGLAVTSHRNGTPNTSTFERITLTD